jgi:hypothetical protein
MGCLEVNDEIAIKTGAGNPSATEKITEVIVAISSEGSALTNTGRILTSEDFDDIDYTGFSPTAGTYPVSDEASDLLKQAPWFKGVLDGFNQEDDPFELL